MNSSPNETQSLIHPIDATDLWCVQIITDYAHGEIKMLIPVDDRGKIQSGRAPRYFSTLIINTPQGPLQHEFEIEAASLADALARYVEACNQAGEDFIAGVRDAELRNSLLGLDAHKAKAPN